MRWWNDHMALTFTTWFSRSRITLNDKHFKVIFNIKHSIPSAKNQKMRLWLLGTLNYARSSTWSRNQCRACLTYWSAGSENCSCGHLMEDDTTENKKYISSVLNLFSIPHFYIRKGRPQGHRYGKHLDVNSTIRQINFKRGVERRNMTTSTTDSSATSSSEKKMIELGRSEEIILEMVRLASEDHSHIATQEEIDVYRGNWWIRSNFVGSDTMPVRHRLDFKKALSTLHHLKAEDKACYQNWSQSSSSSWWQWQTTWWHPSFETSPRRWTWHWSNGETCWTVIGPIIRGMILTMNLVQSYSDHFSNSQRSSVSPTGGVKRTSPDTEDHEQNGYEKVCDDNNIFMTNVDNCDTTYTDKHMRNM